MFELTGQAVIVGRGNHQFVFAVGPEQSGHLDLLRVEHIDAGVDHHLPVDPGAPTPSHTSKMQDDAVALAPRRAHPFV